MKQPEALHFEQGQNNSVAHDTEILTSDWDTGLMVPKTPSFQIYTARENWLHANR